jgi:hypothetical protein
MTSYCDIAPTQKTFRFTGGEIVGEFLMRIGYLAGAHVESCPVYRSILKQRPHGRASMSTLVHRGLSSGQ